MNIVLKDQMFKNRLEVYTIFHKGEGVCSSKVKKHNKIPLYSRIILVFSNLLAQRNFLLTDPQRFEVFILSNHI